jgi:hypothetical protein
MQTLQKCGLRCFTLRQIFAGYWTVLDEKQMREVEQRVDDATRQIAMESDPAELAYWMEMVELLQQAVDHLELLYHQRTVRLEERADEAEMMQMMRTVVL